MRNALPVVTILMVTILIGSLLIGSLLGGCGRVELAPASPGEPSAEPAVEPAAEPPAALEPITIAMGFVPNIQFAPMYVALERGTFAEEGLDVTLDYGMETDLLQRLGSGELRFAIGSGDQVVLARANGLPVRYVLNWYRHFPICIVSLAGSGIDEPQDLVGKTVGTPVTYGASYIGWRAFLDEVGVDPQAVNLQAIGYTQVASLVEGRVDAAVCYAQNEPVQLREAGYDINVFYLDEYTQLVSNGIITNDETIRDRPDLVEGVVRGFLRALEATIEDPDAAYAIARRAIPEMDDEAAALQRAVLEESIALWRAEQPGRSDPEAWRASVEILGELGLLAADVDPESVYTNAFVPSGEHE